MSAGGVADTRTSGAEVVAAIPVHDRPDDLRRLLHSLEAIDTTGLRLRVVVIEDGGTENDALRTDAFPALDLHVLRHAESEGPARCRNRVLAEYAADYYWFLDSDTEAHDPGVLRRMVERLDADPSLAGTGGVLEEQNGAWRVMELDVLPNFLFLYRPVSLEGYTGDERPGVGTCNLLLCRGALERVGGFDESLPRDEDNDWCLRAQRIGFGFHQDAGTLVRHHCSAAGRDSGAFAHFRDPRRYVADLLRSRSALLARHRPWRLPVLPLLDAVCVPLVFYRVRRGVYAVRRYELGLERHGAGGARRFAMLTGLAVRAYAAAWVRALRRVAGAEAPMIPRTLREK